MSFKPHGKQGLTYLVFMRILHFSWTLRKPPLYSHVLPLSRSVQSSLWSEVKHQSQIRGERLSWSVVVKEVRFSVNVARWVSVGQDGLFLSTIVGRSNISPPNTDNQIFAVAHNIAKYLSYSLHFFVTISPGIYRGSKRTINGQSVSIQSVRDISDCYNATVWWKQLRLVTGGGKQITTVSSLFAHKVHQQPGRSSLCSDKEPQPEMHYSDKTEHWVNKKEKLGNQNCPWLLHVTHYMLLLLPSLPIMYVRVSVQPAPPLEMG